jgi:glycosyltransferase involved in cell wall biosynthesis
VRLCFLTSTPLNYRQGSGTYTAIRTLADALKASGVHVAVESADTRIWPYTLRRYLFNLRVSKLDFSSFDAVIGFDLDGFLLPPSDSKHLACVKGVIRDELLFEKGITRLALRIQASWEQKHLNNAHRVLTTSCYSVQRIRILYGRTDEIVVVPELIDLSHWQSLFRSSTPSTADEPFRLLCVCRFYPRKNVQLLLKTMAILQKSELRFELRLVGGGGEQQKLKEMARQLKLEANVKFMENLTETQLASEYRGAHLFCFPSLQEGFGIVLLEAMAAGLPIVAAAKGAIPEVVPHASLVHANNADVWAGTILRLAKDENLRTQISNQGLNDVRQYDAPLVARRFLEVVEELTGQSAPAAAQQTR